MHTYTAHRGSGRRSLHPLLSLVVSIAVCFAAAALGGWLTSTSVTTWYPALAKPTWNPPDWLFGPVWSVLYVLMAVAAWWVWESRGRRSVGVPLALFTVQLALNVAWSGLFFGLHSPGAALIEIVALWVSIAATLLAFLRISRTAGLLLAPYLAWVSFAAVLNFALWQLNR